jgi:sialic acid synthase SpsE
MKTIKINDRIIGKNYQPFVIAEVGVNHNGEIETAKKLALLAKKAGADAVKFQYHIPEKEMLKEVPHSLNFDKPLWEILEETNLTLEEQIEIKNYCDNIGIIYLCTPFSREAADILDEEVGVAAFKIGSGELTNLPLMKHIAKKCKPMIVSTGMSTIEEIKETADFLKKQNAQFVLMHCTSEYPAKYEDVNLKLIPKYIEMFQVPVGLSDHSQGIYTALGSVALGASLLEKHFTLNRMQKGPDHKVSIEPNELTELVEGVNAIYKALGETKKILEEEKPIIAWARESVVSLVDIKQGTTITEDAVWVKRPGTGIPAKYLEKIIGMKTKRDIPKDTLLRWEDLEGNAKKENSGFNRDKG